MDPQELLLTGVLAPALAAGVLLGLGWRVWRREDADSDGRWSGAPALAIAFLLTFYLLSGMPVSLLPDSPRTPTGLDWLAWLAVPAIFLLPLEQKLGRWKHLLRGVVAVAMVRLVLNTAFESTFEADVGRRWLAGLSALYMLIWAALTRVCGQRTGASSPLVLWTMAAGLAVLAALTGSAKIGQLGGALAAALGAATVLAWCRPRLTLAGGGVGLALLLLFGPRHERPRLQLHRVHGDPVDRQCSAVRLAGRPASTALQATGAANAGRRAPDRLAHRHRDHPGGDGLRCRVGRVR